MWTGRAEGVDATLVTATGRLLQGDVSHDPADLVHRVGPGPVDPHCALRRWDLPGCRGPARLLRSLGVRRLQPDGHGASRPLPGLPAARHRPRMTGSLRPAASPWRQERETRAAH